MNQLIHLHSPMFKKYLRSYRGHICATPKWSKEECILNFFHKSYKSFHDKKT